MGVVVAAVKAFSAFIAGNVIAGTIFKVAVSIGITALARAAAKKPGGNAALGGIVQNVTQTGGVNPASFIIGRYATNGSLVAPPMSRDTAGGNPFEWCDYVINLSDHPIGQVTKVWVDGEEVSFTGGLPGVGSPSGKWAGKFLIQPFAGDQTAASAYLLTNYGSYPERPWSADMIGRGVAYAIVSFFYDRELYRGFPQVRFELEGIRLYDPRLDDTVGGSGSHRHDDPTTWGFSENPAVAIYNLLRGIPLEDGSIYGGRFGANDLPLSNWFAAMNACDAQVAIASGTENAYRAGFEVRVDQPPADPIGELLKACSGEVIESGGQVFINVGAPPLPVHFITDDNLIASSPDELVPFPELTSTYNAVSATYPDPAAGWEPRNAPIAVDAAAQADDGRELVGDVALPAVPYGVQVQRLTTAWLKDERRFRQHQITLPREFRNMRGLEVLSWISAHNLYTGKSLEIVSQVLDPLTLVSTLVIREVDPDDYDPATEIPVPPPAILPVTPSIYAVPGFTAAAYTIQDASPDDRRPAIRLTWVTGLAGVTGLRWQLRIAGTSQIVDHGSTEDIEDGEHILHGGAVLPNVGYEVRARLVAHGLETSWTSWAAVTTPDVRVNTVDLFENAVTVVRRNFQSVASSQSSYTLNSSITFSEDYDHETILLGRYNGGAASFSVSDNDEADIFLDQALLLDGSYLTGPYRLKEVYGIPGGTAGPLTKLEATQEFSQIYTFSIGAGVSTTIRMDLGWSAFIPGTSTPRFVNIDGFIDMTLLTVKR